MSSAFSNGTRLFRAGGTLLNSLKSATQTASYSSSAAAAATTHKPKGKLKDPTTTISTKKTTAASTKPNRSSGIFKPLQVSPALGSFLGISEASRSDAVKQIWAYIKLHNLQNPADKREIHCDERLKEIFDGRDKVGFLEIGKLLSPHFVKSG